MASLVIKNFIRFRQRGIVALPKDYNRVSGSMEKKFTRLMQRKFGLRYNLVCKGYVLPEEMLLSPIKESHKMQGKPDEKRARLWSEILFEHIVAILQSGELLEDLSKSARLDISRVKMTIDLSRVDIFWVGAGSAEDAKIQAVLDKCAGALRHQLSQLQAVGFVPPIKFIRDLTRANWLEVNRLLELADYGSDYKPSHSLMAGLAADPRTNLNDRECSSLFRSADCSHVPIAAANAVANAHAASALTAKPAKVVTDVADTSKGCKFVYSDTTIGKIGGVDRQKMLQTILQRKASGAFPKSRSSFVGAMDDGGCSAEHELAVRPLRRSDSMKGIVHSSRQSGRHEAATFSDDSIMEPENTGAGAIDSGDGCDYTSDTDD